VSSASKSAVVTGASSGIGFAIAKVLAEQGYAMTIAARRPDRLAAAADRLRDAGADVEAIATNVASEDEIRSLIQSHQARHGSIDVLVNNAGMGIVGSIDGYRTSHMDLQYAVNLRAIAVCYREALAALRAAARANGTALVINTSSITGKSGASELSMYSAVKHGVVGFTQSMNRELHADGIKSCALCPGYVDTPLSDYIKDTVPPERMITSEDLAEAVRFLTRLSDRCVIPEIVFEQLGGSP
jgi:NAD(P)-dependent dehydrogenase (short-subunit alcohol dehydrogenase family)